MPDWPSLVVGFLLGILASYIGNLLWDRHKAKKRGRLPFLNVTASSDLIHFEGQVQNSERSKSALAGIFRGTIPPPEE